MVSSVAIGYAEAVVPHLDINDGNGYSFIFQLDGPTGYTQVPQLRVDFAHRTLKLGHKSMWYNSKEGDLDEARKYFSEGHCYDSSLYGLNSMANMQRTGMHGKSP